MTFNHLMTDDRQDLRDTLEEARESLEQAIRLLEIYTRETDDRNAQAYLVDQLKIHVGRNHGFLSSDLTIDDLLDRLDDYEPAGDQAVDDANDWVAHCTGNMTWNSELRRYVAVPTDKN